MAEFFELSADERLEALAQAANASGRPPHLLEKDVWVVWSLQHLFAAPYAPHLVFKGGTSLSKAYGVIQRFSEDVDLTYDIRAIAGDLIGDAGTPLPASKSQEKKWKRLGGESSRQRLCNPFAQAQGCLVLVPSHRTSQRWSGRGRPVDSRTTRETSTS